MKPERIKGIAALSMSLSLMPLATYSQTVAAASCFNCTGVGKLCSAPGFPKGSILAKVYKPTVIERSWSCLAADNGVCFGFNVSTKYSFERIDVESVDARPPLHGGYTVWQGDEQRKSGVFLYPGRSYSVALGVPNVTTSNLLPIIKACEIPDIATQSK